MEFKDIWLKVVVDMKGGDEIIGRQTIGKDDKNTQEKISAEA